VSTVMLAEDDWIRSFEVLRAQVQRFAAQW
jgi:hypothetical protein